MKRWISTNPPASAVSRRVQGMGVASTRATVSAVGTQPIERESISSARSNFLPSLAANAVFCRMMRVSSPTRSPEDGSTVTLRGLSPDEPKTICPSDWKYPE
jgi:hypothetical protein